MNQYDLNLRDYWRIIRRRQWIVIIVPFVFSFFTFAMAHLQEPTPTYRATASVRFEKAMNSTALLLDEIITFDPVGDLETQAALIKSFPVISRAAKKLGLIPHEATPEQIRAIPAHLDAISTLPSQLEVKRIERTSLIEISATSSHPMKAARLANSVAEAFQEDNIATRTRQVVEARRFIVDQIREVGSRLRESEEELRAFQESNEILVLSDEARAAVIRLAERRGEHERIKRTISELEAQLRLLKDGRAANRLAGLPLDGADPALAKAYSSLADLTIERENLLLSLRPTHPRVKGLDARIANVRQSLFQAISSKLQLLRARAVGVRKTIARLKSKQASLPEAALEMARRERKVNVNERIFSLLQERLQEVLVKEKGQVVEVSIVRPAMIPEAPLNPPGGKSKAVVGFLIGLVVALVLAFVVEALDTSIGAIDEVESLLGTPVLGVIPQLDIKAEIAEELGQAVALDKATEDRYSFLLSLFVPRSRIAEAYRGLRTNLLFSTLERDFKTILVTSAAQMEGKTTVAINLAITLAQLGKKTLLVEGDLRNPFIHSAFGIPKEPGLTEVVLGSASLDEVTLGFPDLVLGTAGMERLLDSAAMDNLFVLPSGHPPPNPSELVSSQGLVKVLADARQRYDYIILDSTPTLPVADAAILGSRVDGALTVVRVGHVPRAALRRAKTLLGATQTRLLGVCLTGVRAEVSPDYAEMAYYRYRYGPRQKKAQAAGTWPSLVANRKAWGLAGLSLALLALSISVLAWRAGWLELPSFSAQAAPESVPATPAAAPVPIGRQKVQEAPPPPTAPGDAVRPAAPEARLTAPPRHSPDAAFTVRVHAFKSKAKADRVAAAYRGIDPKVFSARLFRNGQWWGVFIGEFGTREEAKAFGETLTAGNGEIEDFAVVPIRPPEP
ncbi:MAG: polysaccharide biosynthesis tyrosine autokinase, partial [Anaerolineae bacterium]